MLSSLERDNLYATLLTGEVFVLGAFVLSTDTGVVLDGAKDAGTKESISFGFFGACVDRLRFGDLSKRP